MLHEVLLTVLQHRSDITDIHIRANEPIWGRGENGLVRISQEIVYKDKLKSFLRDYWKRDADPEDTLRKGSGEEDFSFSIGGYRMRANVFLAGNEMALALRKLSEQIIPFQKLGLPDNVLKLADKNQGLFLVTGPTGSGKSTTLAAIIDYINQSRTAHIITIEDPIEYIFESKKCRIVQRNVGNDTKNFSNALRAALRQDPDILFVGELRDQETTKIALAAAETGHLVFATLHTNNSKESIDRVSSFFDGPEQKQALHMFGSVLNGIVSQTLLRDKNKKICLAAEVLVPTQAVKTHIKENKAANIGQEMETGSSQGQLLLNTSLVDLLKAGRIDLETAMFASYNPIDLEKTLKRNGVS